MPMPGKLSITEMAATYDVSLRTLRFYEEQGLLRPDRTNGSRYYSPQDETRLKLIRKGKALGFTVSEIRSLIGEASHSANETLPGDVIATLNKQQLLTQIKQLEKRRDDIQIALDELTVALECRRE